MASHKSLVANLGTFNDYILNTSNRDRVMSVIQYAAMSLVGPAAATGCPKLSANMKAIHDISSQYRAVTRFSQWLVVGPQLTPQGIREVIKSSPTPLIGVLKTLSTACFSVFLFGEEVYLFAKYNIVPMGLGKKFNKIRFVFLFWSNVARLIVNYLILKRSSYNSAKDSKDLKKPIDHRRKTLVVIDGVLMTMFAYCLLKNSLPAGPQCFTTALKSGEWQNIIACFVPPPYRVSDVPHGILGIIASIPGFMLSVL